MNTLDQVILLEQKVESAVEKIQQLQAENDALRSKCEQLTNALSAKSEQLSSFETDNSKIENGIQKALDRLNSIENSILKNDGQVPSIQNNSNQTNQNNSKEEDYSNPAVQVVQDFNSMDNVIENEQTEENNFQNTNTIIENESQENQSFEEENSLEEDNSQDEDLGFDIF